VAFLQSCLLHEGTLVEDGLDNLPHPNCNQCYDKHETFGWEFDSDDKEGTLTAISKAGKVM
jgi:hypothetical protein